MFIEQTYLCIISFFNLNELSNQALLWEEWSSREEQREKLA